MPWTDPEKQRAYQRAWRERNREAIRERERQRRAADPEKYNAYQRAWREKNPEARRESHRRWRERNPQYARLRHVASRYGISVDDYLALVELQNGLCAICGRPETGLNKSGKLRILGVDHCHRTGKVRGLLCAQCNFALGPIEEVPDWLARAAEYLRRTT